MNGKDTDKSGSSTGAGAKQNTPGNQAKATNQAKAANQSAATTAQAKAGRNQPASGKPAGKASSTAGTNGGGQAAGGNGKGGQSGGTDAIQLLKQQHANLRQLIATHEAADESDRTDSLDQLLAALANHTRLEDDVLLPAAQQAGIDSDLLDRLQVQRDLTKILSAELMQASPGDDFFDANVSILTKMVGDIIDEEEKPRTGILALLKGSGVDLADLGRQIEDQHDEFDTDDGGFELPAPRALRVISIRQGMYDEENGNMQNYTDRDDQGRFMSEDDREYRGRSRSRYEDDDRRGGGFGRGIPERDEYGRFMSEGDDYRGGGRSSRSSEYRDYDDDRRGGSRGGRMPERDEYGRFMSDDDRGGRSYSSRSSRNEDYGDNRRSSSRGSGRGEGHGGWFGDPEGHSQAARRGWEEREGWSSRGRSSRYEDDDNRRSSRGSGHGGWFGDSEGHSEAARRGWEERDQGYRGRSSYEDDDRSSRSRGRYSEDDDRRSRNR